MNALKSIALALFVLAATSAYADQFVGVTVDTSSIAGTSGSLDFQFNPGPTAGQAANVTVLNFAGGSFAGLQQDFGNVSGGPVGSSSIVLNNTAQDNEDFETFHFGNLLSFVLDFSGPAVNNPNGTSTSTNLFAFMLFSDANGTIPVLTHDPNGVIGLVTVNLNGTVTMDAVSPEVVLTPEPSSLLLVGGGLILGAYLLRRRRTV